MTERKYIRIPAETADLMTGLTDAERGRLITALITVAVGGKVEELPGNERLVFPALAEKMKKEAKAETKQEKKHRHGELGHVMLTDDEADKLRARFGGECDARIARLDRYIEQTGKSYASHYQTIINWALKDAAKAGTPVNATFDTDDFFAAAVQRAYR